MPLIRERPYYVEEHEVIVQRRPNLLLSVLWGLFVLSCAVVFYFAAMWLMQFVVRDMQQSFVDSEPPPLPVMRSAVPAAPGNRPLLPSANPDEGATTTTTTTTSVRKTTEVSKPTRVPGT